jgi:hypothetical protein
LNKLLIATGFAITAVLICVATFAYTQLPNKSPSNQEESVSPSTIPTPTHTLIPSPIHTPSPTASSSLNPTNGGSFGPFGSFTVTTPAAKIYDTNKIILSIHGETIAAQNVHLTMCYSLDGQDKIPVTVEVKQAHERDPFFSVVTATVALPPLTSGSHSITVYASLQTPEDHTAQATVNFTVID